MEKQNHAVKHIKCVETPNGNIVDPKEPSQDCQDAFDNCYINDNSLKK